MKKSLLLVVSTAFLFAGCSKVENKLNRMFGSATPAPVATATPAPTAMPSASPKPTTAPKAVVTPKPAMKK